ncbi:MAG: hypothetical protein JW928_03375 [Candidatus Aureabacteria bacterium]|nr:hypothetical protein [Candidatus Auribacterota bacterium]
MKWLISRIEKECRQCHHVFQDGEYVYSTVVLRDDSDEMIETERSDFCLKCWTSAGVRENPFWKCLFTDKEEEKAPQLPDRDTVMGFFRGLLERGSQDIPDEEKRENEVMTYLLALMLERKKRLLLCEQGREKAEWNNQIFYKDSRTSDIFQVTVPELNEEEIKYFQEKIKALLPLQNKQSAVRKSVTDGPEMV